jgi:predicted ABC-type ATPase
LRVYAPTPYYIATEDPVINISRVCHRVKMGGHPVPEDKIISRYYRSLDLLFDAVRYSHRAYIFDNSGSAPLWLAEVTEGKALAMKVDTVPQWFKLSFWDKFEAIK